MSPSAPMPKMAWVGTNGLNAWVIVLSGELSMMRVPEAEEFEFEFDEPVELLDEHAPAPAARSAAATTAASFLWPGNLEIILVFLSVERSRAPRFLREGLTRHVPPPCDCARMPGAATSSRQHAAARTAETRRSGGSSVRQRSSASGQRTLNGQPVAAGPVPAGWRPPGAVPPGLVPPSGAECAAEAVGIQDRADLRPACPVPPRSVLPRLSGSGAEATRSWVYGCAGRWVSSSAGPRSTISPPYMTSTSSAK